jgi:hypothetical protein
MIKKKEEKNEAKLTVN